MSMIPETTEALDLSSAAALMGKALDESERMVDAESPEPESNVVSIATGKTPEPTKVEAVEDEDLEFELPAEEEGKEARRLKLSELYSGYEKAAKLEKELETVRSETQRMPAEYTSALQDIVAKRATYIERLDLLEKAIVPQKPHRAYIDPTSEHYNPDYYAQQMQDYENKATLLRNIAADKAKNLELQEEQNKVLSKARLASEFEAMGKVWPEFIRDPKVRQEAAKVLEDYGYKKDEIDGIEDHRHLRFIKDSLELRALKAKQAEAVKVVRSTPKLVKGAARSTNPQAASRDKAMSALKSTGSMDAAVRALNGLI